VEYGRIGVYGGFRVPLKKSILNYNPILKTNTKPQNESKQDRIEEIVQWISVGFADVFNKAFENYKK
jgi:hypothetical protein